MKNIYCNSQNTILGKLILAFIFVTVSVIMGFGQVQVNFTPRVTYYNPSIKGDFQMIGNTNLTMVDYTTDGTNSNNDMKVVDLDGDNSTTNSSAATLTYSTENGAVPANSTVLFAGLYWTGRTDGTIAEATLKAVKIKKTGGTYVSKTASGIRFPGDNDMYAAYVDVTSYVQSNGAGEYWVANVACKTGNGGSTGYYGGWGMVVVYSNPAMNLRDITIFDGYAYVAGNISASYDLPVSGFKTVQSGNVKMKLGMMAGEGDVSISGDYFKIKDQSNNWVALNHGGNSATNFFNSSVYTGGNARNPNLVNNTGIDISMFYIPNTGNSIITNNQTSTTFRYGSTQDTYIIHCIAMASDAYLPGISLTKTCSPTCYSALNEAINYTISVTNNGNVNLNTVTVSDSKAITGPTKISGDGGIIGTLEVGETWVYSAGYTVKQADLTTGNIINTATVTAKDPNNTQVSAQGSATTYEKPAVSSASAGTVCSGVAQNYDITSSVGGTSYTWSRAQVNGISNAAVSNQTSNPITETLTNTTNAPVNVIYLITPAANGCTGAQFTYTVTVNPKPAVTSAATGTICSETAQNYTITSSVTGSTFNWSRALVSGISNAAVTNQTSNPITESLVNTTTAPVNVVYLITPSANGCSGNQFTYTVTVNPKPSVSSSATGTICSGVAQNYNITSAVSGTAYNWSRALVNGISNTAVSNQTSDPITETLTNTTNSAVNVVYLITPAANGCTGAQFAYTVTVIPKPSVTSAATGAICSGVSQNYDITSGVSGTTYTWSRASVAGISNAAVSNQTSDPITETLINTTASPVNVIYLITPSANGCTGAQFTYTVSVTPKPVISSASAGTICSEMAQNYTITSSVTGSTYNWSRALVSGISNAAVTNQTGNPITESLVNTTSAPVNVVYLITPSANGCSGTQFTYTVTVNPKPSVSSSATGTICSGVAQNYNITSAVPGTTYTWSRALVTGISNLAVTNQTSDPITETLTNTTNAAVNVAYLITPSANGCNGSQFTYTVTVNPKPVISSSASGTICSESAQNYTITSTVTGSTYNWSRALVTGISNAAVSNQTGNPITESLVNTTSAPVNVGYLITPSANGCSGNQFSYTVTVNPRPSVSSSASGTICSGVAQNYNITSVVAGTTYTWSRALVTGISNAAVSNQTSDPITETLINTTASPVNVIYLITPSANGCTGAQFSYSVTVNPKPSCSISGSDAVYTNSTNSYSAPAGMSSYSWTVTGNGVLSGSSTGQTINIVAGSNCNQAYTISLSTTNGYSCSSNCSLNVSVTGPIFANYDQAPPVNGFAGGTAFTNVLSNDELNCAPVVASEVTTTFVSSTNAGVTLSGTNVVVAPGTPAGNYILIYRICEIAHPTNCDTALVKVPVTAAPILANIDYGTSTNGYTGGTSVANVLTNDLLNGAAVVPSKVTTTFVSSSNSGITLSGTSVMVAAGTPAGNYTLIYRICEILNPTNCDTALVRVPVSASVIDAVADAGSTVNGFTGGTSFTNVLVNDLLNGVAVIPSEVVTTFVSSTNSGVTLSGTNVVVAPGTPAGNYTLTYQICEVLNPTNCDQATVTVPVSAATILANIDYGTSTNGYTGGTSVANVLTNDLLNGAAVVPSKVTTTFVSSSNAGITLSGTSVMVAAGTPAGNYTLIYRICEILNPTNCDTALVRVPVSASVIDAVADAGSTVNGFTGGTSFTNVLVNDLLNGVSVIPSEVLTTFVSSTNSGVSLSGTNVVVAPGTPAGNYTLTYQICEVLNPTNCDQATVTVPVSAATIDAVNDDFVSNALECSTGGVAGNVLQNDLLNGLPVIASDITITVLSNGGISGLSIASNGNISIPTGVAIGTYTVTYRICEVINNSNCDQANVYIKVTDTQPPVITCPANISQTNDPGLCGANVTILDPTAIDNCSSTFLFTGIRSDGLAITAVYPVGSTTITWTAKDNAGNSSISCTQLITITDDEEPTIICPPNITIHCPDSDLPSHTGYATATDNCNPAPVITYSDVVAQGNCAGNYNINRTWSATDSKNVNTCLQVITVTDVTAPVIAALPATTTINCPSVPQFATATATDECGSSFTLTYDDVTTPGACAGSYSVTRTWTAKDACNNSSTGSQTINVQDVTAPVIAPLPGPTTINCPDTPVFATATATDECGSSFTLEYHDVTIAGSPACAGNYSITRTWTATDACGNTSTASQVINFLPAALPLMVAPDAITVACGQVPAPSTISFTNGLPAGCLISGTSNFSTFTAVPGPCGGTITETWTATDICGRVLAPVSRIITVQPAALPIMTVLGDITVGCGQIPAPSTISFTNSKSGGCLITGTSNLSTFTATPGACGGTVIETWTATDVCGRELSSVSRTITVSPAALPAMTAPGNITVACGSIPQASTVSFTNNLGGGCLIAGTSDLSTFTATPEICGGTVIETWTAIDVCGRPLTSVSRIITVSPAAMPVFATADDITVACGQATTSALSYTNGLSGACQISGTVTSTLNNQSPAGYCGGDITETWTVTVCGNTITKSRIIHVSPAALPVFATVVNTTVPCGGVNNHELTYDNGLQGNCRIYGAVSSTLTSIPGPCGGDVTETWTVVVCGNTITTARIIHVNPAPAPVFATVQDITVSCGGATTSDLTYDNGLTGNCKLSGTATSSLSTIPGVCGGDVTETWTAVVCGNTITKSRIIHVSPAAMPVFATAEDITVACGQATTSVLTYTNGLSGACLISGNVTSTLSNQLPAGNCGGDITESWTVTVCGNTVTKSRTIHVSPAAMPVFATVVNTIVPCGGVNNHELTYDNGLQGNCRIQGAVSSTLSTIPGPCGGDVTETWTVVVCGNTITTSRIIHVNPAPAPVFATVQDITVSCGGATTSDLTYSNGLTNNCQLQGTVTSTLSTIPGACGGDVTETWTTVVCGNTITKSRIIHVSPATLPAMSPLADITVSCGGLPAPGTISYSNGLNGGCLISGTSNMSTFSAIPGPCGGFVTETWTASDACGRTIAPVSRTIEVMPAALPVMTAPANITVSCDALPTPITISFTNGLSGNCNLSGVSNPSTFTTIIPGTCNGQIVEQWTAADACGRALAPVSRIITVNDNTAPVISCPSSPQIRTIPSGQAGYTAIGNEFDYANLSDNCSSVAATNNLNGSSTLSGQVFLPGTTNVVWTAVDECGNTAQCSYDVVIYSPSISLVKTGTLNLGAVTPDAIANIGDQITYSFTVTNTGNATLTNVIINDPLVAVSGGPVTLAPGASDNSTFTAVYSLTLSDILAGTFTNVATATGTTLQGVTVSSTDDDVQQFYSIAGNIFDDNNGMNNSSVSGSPTNGSGNLYMNLVSADKGVVASVPVNPDGTYFFTMNDGVEYGTSYDLILTSSPQTEGSPLTAASYPSNWVSTGEILGTGNGNDGTVNGILSVSTGMGSVYNANFGLDQLPDSFNANGSYQNPGGTNTVQAPLLAGTDPEDGPLGSNTTIVITSLAINGTLYYNGVAVTLNQIIPSYNPSLLRVDPIDGDVTVTFNYAFIDLAGEQDPTPALVSLHFYLCPVLVTIPQHNCSPGTVNLTSSAVTAGSTLNGATLSYWKDANATVPMLNPLTAGTGTYYIKATNANCSDIKPVTVNIHPLPTVYTVSGSGSYCAGGQGLEIIMNGSQPGVLYTLWHGLYSPLGAAVIGTGGPISFGFQTMSGLYSILAENPVTHCINWTFNCVDIWIDQPVQVGVSVQASANPVPTGTPVIFTATPVHGGSTPTYQWKVNGLNAGANSAIFTYVPLNGDEVTCILVSNAYCVTGNPASASMTMQVDGVSPVITVTGIVQGGLDKCFNATQTLTVAGGGNTFTVQSGATATMIAGHNIRYLPGTTVMAGGYMHGYITTDDQYCGQQAPAIPTVVAGGSEQPATSTQSMSFSIYPNPTSGNFTVEQKGEGMPADVKVEVYSMRGEKVMTGEIIGEKKHEFWLSNLPHGLYFVKVLAGDYIETFKLVKTR